MNTTELEQLSENEMYLIKGGTGRWLLIDGQWVWVDVFDLGDDDNEST